MGLDGLLNLLSFRGVLFKDQEDSFPQMLEVRHPIASLLRGLYLVVSSFYPGIGDSLPADDGKI